MAILLCCLVSCLLAWIPYVVPGCKDVEHRCGRCNALLAVWTARGKTDVVGIAQAVGSAK